MSANWAFDLDLLAQNKVIDFDGSSFVMGTPSRYIGNPNIIPSGQTFLPDMPNINQQPVVDEFKHEKDSSIVKNPGWKKWAFGILATAGILALGSRLKSNNLLSFNGVKNNIGNFFKNAGTKIKSTVNPYINKFSKKAKTP